MRIDKKNESRKMLKQSKDLISVLFIVVEEVFVSYLLNKNIEYAKALLLTCKALH